MAQNKNSKRIRIGIVLSVLALGGTQRSAIGIAKYIDKKRFETQLIFLHKPTNHVERLENLPYTVVPQEKIVRYLNEQGYDAVLLYSDIPDIDQLTSPVIQSVIFSYQYREDALLNLMSSMTEYVKIKYLIGAEPKNSEVLYLQLDTDSWDASKEVEPFTLPNNNITVGRLGRETPSKWEWSILATMCYLKRQKKIDDINFVFLGMPAPYKLFVRLFFRKQLRQGTIQLYRETSDQKTLSRFFHTIDLFLQASWIGESFGCVITESFYHRTPVLTDWKGFLRDDNTVDLRLYDTQIEVVDETCGYYAKHPMEIADIITRATKKELAKKGRKGYEKTLQKYTVKTVVKNFEDMLRNYLFDEQHVLNPSLRDVHEYERTYLKKIRKLKSQYQNIPLLSRVRFRVSSTLWRGVEYSYLFYRKLVSMIR